MVILNICMLGYNTLIQVSLSHMCGDFCYQLSLLLCCLLSYESGTIFRVILFYDLVLISFYNAQYSKLARVALLVELEIFEINCSIPTPPISVGY